VLVEPLFLEEEEWIAPPADWRRTSCRASGATPEVGGGGTMDMTDESDLRDFERRIWLTLHAAAPRPAPDLADRLLRRTAVVQQRRGFGLSFAPALAAAVVVVAAVAVGIGLGNMLPRGSNEGGPSEPTMTSAPPSPTLEAPPSPSPTEAVPSPSASVGPFPGGAASCENESIGFVVSYPADWWANERVDSGDPPLTPIEACQYFAEEPVELVQNAGLPPGIVINAGLEEQPLGNPEQPIEVLSSRVVEVAGRPATVEEIERTGDTVFQRAGDRSYAYRISLASGETLLFGTLNQRPSEHYDSRKLVLDRMMETL
jgi:hypothetical protein